MTCFHNLFLLATRFTHIIHEPDKIMRDENKKPIRVQIAVCRHRPRMVHNLMITPEEEGGFCEARDKDGNVLISETKLRQTWPQHIKFMTKRFKEMCACDKCGVSHDIQRSYNIKRMKIIKKLDRDVASMRDGRRKEEFHARIQKYKEEILVNGDLNVKRMSKAAEGVTCPCISINGLTLPRFACVLGDCTLCNNSYRPNIFEASRDETIKYMLYSPIHQCSWHGEQYLEEIETNGKPKRICTKCENMTTAEIEEKRKTSKSAKIFTKQYRSLYVKPLSEFVKIGGVYHNTMKMYRLHRWHRIFLGTDGALKMFRNHLLANPGTHMLTNRDHSERYQPSPDGEFQTEHFAKHQSLSMEGCAAYYCNIKTGKDQLTFYSHLSDEKRQDAGTVASNIRSMLRDLLFKKKEICPKRLQVLISFVDGCAVQYRSGSVCYELCHLAMEFGIVYDRIIQAPHHGKCIVDSKNGADKTLLEFFFDNLVAHPEEMEKGLRMVQTHTRDEDGKLVSLAKVCYEILNDPDRTHGAKSHANRAKRRKIEVCRYILRLPGEASGEGVKYKCKDEGIMSCYNVRADPELLKDGEPLVIAMRRFPCCCDGCLKKLSEPIETRYQGPSDTCIYWELFKKSDGKSGYNDWRLVEIVPRPKGYREEDVQERMSVTLRGIGLRMAEQVSIGGYGAYPVKDDQYDYYLVKWTHMPTVADRDEEIELDGEQFLVKEGDIICEGKWLDKIPETTDWWYETEQRCIVRLQTVVDASIELMPISDENPLPSRMRRESKLFAHQHNALKVDRVDHDRLIQESLHRGAFDHDQFIDVSDNESEAEDGSDESDIEEC